MFQAECREITTRPFELFDTPPYIIDRIPFRFLILFDTSKLFFVIQMYRSSVVLNMKKERENVM